MINLINSLTHCFERAAIFATMPLPTSVTNLVTIHHVIKDLLAPAD
jgi:hypothetical protein